MKSVFTALEEVIGQDPGHRGIAPLIEPGDLEAASRSLADASLVVLTTGFWIPDAAAPETDGPLGAWDLGNALRQVGVHVRVLADQACRPLLEKVGFSPFVNKHEVGELPGVSHLVAIERPGRCQDGSYRTLRGIDISEHVEAIDDLFFAPPQGIKRIGVGDGGNEIGMGNRFERVQRVIPRGEVIASTAPADWLIVAGVSNWGAWGLVAGLSIARGRNLLPRSKSTREFLNQLVAAGAVDGLTGRNEATVDGLAWEVHEEVLDRLDRHVSAYVSG